MNDGHANHKKKVLVSRREFLKGGALATAALSSGVLALEPAEAGRVPEDISLDPRWSIVQLQVNGVPYRVEVPNRTTLLRLLREELRLTGTKMGCDRAQWPVRLLLHHVGAGGLRWGSADHRRPGQRRQAPSDSTGVRGA